MEKVLIVAATRSRRARAAIFGSQHFPLFLREHVPQRQLQARVGFFEFRARLRDTIDLREDFGIVGLGRVHQRFQRRFFFLKIRAEVDQPQAVPLEDIVHLALLIGCKFQQPDHVRVVPPFAPGTGSAAIRSTPAGSTRGRWRLARTRRLGEHGEARKNKYYG